MKNKRKFFLLIIIIGVMFFFLGEKISFFKQQRILLNILRECSIVVLTVAGVWISILYPSIFSKIFSFQNDYINDKENEKITDYLILIIKYSILIIICSFLIEILATILNVYVKPIFFRQLLRKISFSMFGILFYLQILLFLYIYIISDIQKRIINNKVKFNAKVRTFIKCSSKQAK